MSELFEIFNEKNELLGKEERDVVHKKGLYHRAVNIMLFNSKGQLLIQKRAIKKDTNPGKWDLSTAEHLKPRETYGEAAERGVKEELGISLKLELIRRTHLQKNSYPNGTMDFEFVQTWKGVSDDSIKLDKEEVEEVKFLDIHDLKKEIKENPTEFTPSFKEEINSLPNY